MTVARRAVVAALLCLALTIGAAVAGGEIIIEHSRFHEQQIVAGAGDHHHHGHERDGHHHDHEESHRHHHNNHEEQEDAIAIQQRKELERQLHQGEPTGEAHFHDHHDGHHHGHGHHHHHGHEDHGHHGHQHHHGDHHEAAAAAGVVDSRHLLLREQDKHPLTAFALTTISGMAAAFGGLIVVCMGAPSAWLMGHMLSFAGGIMLYISYGDLMPHAIMGMTSPDHGHDHDHHDHGHSHDSHARHNHGDVTAFRDASLWFFGGMALFLIITAFLPEPESFSDGGEEGEKTPSHGHSHGIVPRASAALAAVIEEEDGKDTPTRSSTSISKKRQRSASPSSSSAGIRRRNNVTSAITTINSKESSSSSASSAAKPSKQLSSTTTTDDRKQKSSLLMTGVIAALGISLHNLPEGLIVYNQTITGICSAGAAGTPPSAFTVWLQSFSPYLSNLLSTFLEGADISSCFTRGLVVTFAILLHNIPEGMAVAAPVYLSSGSKWHAMKLCILSSLCEPLAAVVFGWFFSSYLTSYLVAALNAGVSGIMVALVLVELIPTAATYVGAKQAAFSHLLGQGVMFASLYAMRSSGVH